MNKVPVHVMIDPIVLEEAKTLGINISRFCSDSIEQFILLKKKDVDASKLHIVKQELEIKEENLKNSQVEVSKLREKARLIEDQQKLKELDDLRLEEERLKEQKSCKGCNFLFETTEKAIKYSTNILLCQNCWDNLPRNPVLKKRLDEINVDNKERSSGIENT